MVCRGAATSSPPSSRGRRPTRVKFDYGADTIFLASGVDEPKGNEIAQVARHALAEGAQPDGLTVRPVECRLG